MEDAAATLSSDVISAVIFDMDGVVTDTARIHAAAWTQLFDEYLRQRSARTGESFQPFDPVQDYLRYVDGKPRYDGVRDFLASRGIEIPEGAREDPADRETVCGLGNRKDRSFRAALDDQGARAYPSTVALVRALKARGVATAIVSASRNMTQVLEAAGLVDLFEVRVDGVVSDERKLPGKPDPGVFLEAARELGVEPARAAVVEDALAGVEAGRRGGFGLVIGVNRGDQARALHDAGADVVVTDLVEVQVVRRIRNVPDADAARSEIAERAAGKRLAVFLDYDGTLTPIVNDPAAARLPDATRRAMERLAARAQLAVVSGRGLADVRAMVGIEGIWYAGSHGFDIVGPNGESYSRGEEFLPSLDAAESELRPAIEAVPGARLERKGFAIAVHFRQADESRVRELEKAVESAVARHEDLRMTGGKKIFELRPALPWDKGKALLWLLESIDLDGEDVVPVYVGDDETDEDAFRAILGRGIGVVVHGEADDRDTAADYALADPSEVRVLLDLLADIAEGRP